MDRITYIEIAGRKCPLNFSIAAAEAVAERYGDLGNVSEAFTGKSTKEMLNEAIFLLDVLISQGVAYKKIIDGEDVKAFSKDELKIVMTPSLFGDVKDKIMDAMLGGMKRDVEVEPDQKNANATQGQ